MTMNVYGSGMAFGLAFTLVPLMIGAVFVFIISQIVIKGVKYAGDKGKPIIPTQAKVVDKRTHVRGDHAFTTYYATFELENGERLELEIPSNKIGYIVEGDHGILSFQGELFVSFTR